MSSRRRLLLGGAAACLTACGRKNPIAPPESQPGSRKKRYSYPAPETVVPNRRGPARPALGSAVLDPAPLAAPAEPAFGKPGEVAGSATE